MKSEEKILNNLLSLFKSKDPENIELAKQLVKNFPEIYSHEKILEYMVSQELFMQKIGFYLFNDFFVGIKIQWLDNQKIPIRVDDFTTETFFRFLSIAEEKNNLKSLITFNRYQNYYELIMSAQNTNIIKAFFKIK